MYELLLDLKEPEGLDTSVMERVSEGVMSLTGSEKSTTIERIKGKLSDVVSTRVEQVSTPIQDGEGNEIVFVLQEQKYKDVVYRDYKTLDIKVVNPKTGWDEELSLGVPGVNSQQDYDEEVEIGYSNRSSNASEFTSVLTGQTVTLQPGKGAVDTVDPQVTYDFFKRAVDSLSKSKESETHVESKGSVLPGQSAREVLEGIARQHPSESEVKVAFEKLREQRAFSDSVSEALSPAVHSVFPEMVSGGGIGSYYRGTNLDSKPDIDIMFLGFPQGEGKFNWQDVNTYADGLPDGITDLQKVGEMDPKMMELITQSSERLGQLFPESHPSFQYVKSWKDGLVVGITVDHPTHGKMNFDINMLYGKEYFGVDHAKKFNSYLDGVTEKYGEERMIQLLEDIKTLKAQSKMAATREGGKIDKTKKIPGLVIEALFTHTSEPLTYEQLKTQLKTIDWNTLDNHPRKDRIHDATGQLVSEVGILEEDKSLDTILTTPALSSGGYASLKALLSN